MRTSVFAADLALVVLGLPFASFVLLALQGVAEVIKKTAVALGVRAPTKLYERPVQ